MLCDAVWLTPGYSENRSVTCLHYFPRLSIGNQILCCRQKHARDRGKLYHLDWTFVSLTFSLSLVLRVPGSRCCVLLFDTGGNSSYFEHPHKPEKLKSYPLSHMDSELTWGPAIHCSTFRSLCKRSLTERTDTEVTGRDEILNPSIARSPTPRWLVSFIVVFNSLLVGIEAQWGLENLNKAGGLPDPGDHESRSVSGSLKEGLLRLSPRTYLRKAALGPQILNLHLSAL